MKDTKSESESKKFVSEKRRARVEFYTHTHTHTHTLKVLGQKERRNSHRRESFLGILVYSLGMYLPRKVAVKLLQC